MKISSITTDKKADALVIGKFEGKAIKGLPPKIQEQVNRFKGELHKVRTFSSNGMLAQEHLIVVGLGKEKEITDERVRKACGIATKVLSSFEAKTAVTALQEIASLRSIIEGFMLGSYVFDKYKSKKDETVLKELFLRTNEKTKDLDEQIKLYTIITDAVNFARDLDNEPAGSIYPETFARIARTTVKNVEVFDVKRLQKEQFNGTLAVGRASKREPRAVIIKHLKGKGDPIVLVGKGVTFDSGGLSLKPTKGMEDMWMDMSGGAAVLATIKAIQELNLKVNVVGIIPLAENMINGNSYKIGDVIKARNNVTVEIGNTDAEGRLLLMDALAYSKEFKPKAVINLATLTGAIVVALGNQVTGMFSTDDELSKELYQAGERSGDRVWRMPCWEDYDQYIKGHVADWRNVGKGKAGSITAARFLQKFTPITQWAHLDIAGTAILDEESEYFRKGGSGAGVRLLIEYLRNA